LAFSLSFIENPEIGRFSFGAETEILGRICFGDFEEYFAANITFWSSDEYFAQWKDGLSRTCDGAATSCILTSVSRPEMANYLQTWPIYRFGSEVIFQNRLFMLDEVGGAVSVQPVVRHGFALQCHQRRRGGALAMENSASRDPGISRYRAALGLYSIENKIKVSWPTGVWAIQLGLRFS
jgi:hypothetical protein